MTKYFRYKPKEKEEEEEEAAVERVPAMNIGSIYTPNHDNTLMNMSPTKTINSTFTSIALVCPRAVPWW